MISWFKKLLDGPHRIEHQQWKIVRPVKSETIEIPQFKVEFKTKHAGKFTDVVSSQVRIWQASGEYVSLLNEPNSLLTETHITEYVAMLNRGLVEIKQEAHAESWQEVRIYCELKYIQAQVEELLEKEYYYLPKGRAVKTSDIIEYKVEEFGIKEETVKLKGIQVVKDYYNT
jgi:hypothetical protein